MAPRVKATAGKGTLSKVIKHKRPGGNRDPSDPSAKSKPQKAGVSKPQKAASQVVRDHPIDSNDTESRVKGPSDGKRKTDKKPPGARSKPQAIEQDHPPSGKLTSAREEPSDGKRKADKKHQRTGSGDREKSRAGPSDGKKTTAKKPRRARSKEGQEQELMPPPTKKQRKRSPASGKGRVRVKDGKTVPLSSNQTNKWKVLTQDGLDYLTAAIDETVLSLLSQRFQEKDAIQKHLNNLKGRLLARCRDLKVPPGIPGQYKNIQSKLELEAQQLEYNQEILEHLQEDIDDSVGALERIGEEMESLQYKIQFLKNEDAEEEGDSRPLGLAADNHFLELPRSGLDAPLLQEEVLRIKNHEALLLDLQKVRSTAAARDMQALVEQAYAEVDSL